MINVDQDSNSLTDVGLRWTSSGSSLVGSHKFVTICTFEHDSGLVTCEVTITLGHDMYILFFEMGPKGTLRKEGLLVFIRLKLFNSDKCETTVTSLDQVVSLGIVNWSYVWMSRTFTGLFKGLPFKKHMNFDSINKI